MRYQNQRTETVYIVDNGVLLKNLCIGLHQYRVGLVLTQVPESTNRHRTFFAFLIFKSCFILIATFYIYTSSFFVTAVTIPCVPRVSDDHDSLPNVVIISSMQRPNTSLPGIESVVHVTGEHIG